MNFSSSALKRSALCLLISVTCGAAFAQTIYVPGGTVGTSSNGNVGIGTSSPGRYLSVHGTIGVGPDELPIQETNFGYGSSYKVLRLGLDQSMRALALNIDPSVVSGGNFSGNGQILIGNRGVLAPNATGADWMSVLRATEGKVFLGGSMSSGEVLGDGLVVAGTNVGIGTSSPVVALEIVGSVKARPVAGSFIFAPTIGSALFTAQRATQSTGQVGIEILGGTNGTNWQLYQPTSSNDFRIFGNSGDRMTITTTGNVGIGTASPGSKLEVVDTGGTLSIRAINSSVNGASIGVKATDTGGREWAFLANASGSGAAGTASIYDVAANIRAMTFTQSGNVGIGTTNPAHKLAVNGTIRAKEVIVDTGWSDYVFAAGYRLAPLAEVEAHIREKKHLPGIPSAAEVEQGGVSLGDMQSRLLAKIEELTLHQIAQEKRLQKLETENAALRAGRP